MPARMKEVETELSGVAANILLSDEVAQEMEVLPEGEDYLLALTDHVDRLLENRLPASLWCFLAEYSYKQQKPLAVLNAHGCRQNGVWVFNHKGRHYPVQAWVTAHEKQYAAIALCICDDSTYAGPPITSGNNCLLLLPDGLVYFRVGAECHHWQLWHPTYGEIDAYCVEHARQHLIL